MACVALDGVTFVAPTVNVVFIGIKGTESIKQSLAPLPQTIADGTTDVKTILVSAAQDRLLLSEQDAVSPLGLNLGRATIYRSTALTLAPKTAIQLTAHVSVEPHDPTDPAPMKQLFLLVHMKVEHLAAVRARAAFQRFEALKMEANCEGITFSHTTFDGLCGLKGDAFAKVMGRVKGVPTPTDGNQVAKLEMRIATYRADLAKLKSELADAAAARELVNEMQSPAPTGAAANAGTPATAMPTPAPAETAAEGEGDPPTPLKVKPAFGKFADAFLMTFISKWIADEKNRSGRVSTMKAILAAVKNESAINSAGWDAKNLGYRLKKLAAKVRHPQVPE